MDAELTDSLLAGSDTRCSIQLNSAYQEFAERYGFGILPARPRKPKDKSLAEIGVQIVQRWVLDELNKQINYWMTPLNERITRTYPKSRLARFQELDVPALKSLPSERYAFSLWRYQVRVESDYLKQTSSRTRVVETRLIFRP